MILRCPDCQRRTVRLRLRSNGEDHYACTWHINGLDSDRCGWSAFCVADTADDRHELARLDAAQVAR